MSDDQTRTKDPSAVLDYTWDWAPWLGMDTISTSTVTAPAGLVVNSSAHSNSAVTAWIAGGTVDQLYRVVCRIVTAGGRTDERSMFIQISER